MESGYKVDFWILKDLPFDALRFARKRPETAWGIVLKVSTPEDTILAKLRWAKQSGGSEKQFTDALRIYEVQYPLLDMAYLDEWAGRLNVSDLWARLKSEASAGLTCNRCAVISDNGAGTSVNKRRYRRPRRRIGSRAPARRPAAAG